MLDPTTATALVGGMATVIAAVVGFLSSRFTSRQTRAAAVEQNRLAAQQDFRATLDEIASNLRKELADERSRREADHREAERKLADVRDRISALERERESHTRVINALNRYCRHLIDLLHDAGITPPEPPPEFGESKWHNTQSEV